MASRFYQKNKTKKQKNKEQKTRNKKERNNEHATFLRLLLGGLRNSGQLRNIVYPYYLLPLSCRVPGRHRREQPLCGDNAMRHPTGKVQHDQISL